LLPAQRYHITEIRSLQMSNVRTTLALVPEGKSSVMKFNKLDEHLTEWINSAASRPGHD